jgi:phosphoribosylformimino-5-aminoimidazole carboxamide ribotide isomerase
MWQLLDELVQGGLKHLLCTDISRDGALSGPNLDLYSDITGRYPGLQLQASGGVSSLSDLQQLKPTGSAGVITGKALLEQRFSVTEALEVLK